MWSDEKGVHVFLLQTNMPVHSPAAGVLEELLVKDGDTVTAGKNLFKLRVGGRSESLPVCLGVFLIGAGLLEVGLRVCCLSGSFHDWDVGCWRKV